MMAAVGVQISEQQKSQEWIVAFNTQLDEVSRNTFLSSNIPESPVVMADVIVYLLEAKSPHFSAVTKIWGREQPILFFAALLKKDRFTQYEQEGFLQSQILKDFVSLVLAKGNTQVEPIKRAGFLILFFNTLVLNERVDFFIYAMEKLDAYIREYEEKWYLFIQKPLPKHFESEIQQIMLDCRTQALSLLITQKVVFRESDKQAFKTLFQDQYPELVEKCDGLTCLPEFKEAASTLVLLDEPGIQAEALQDVDSCLILLRRIQYSERDYFFPALLGYSTEFSSDEKNYISKVLDACIAQSIFFGPLKKKQTLLNFLKKANDLELTDKIERLNFDSSDREIPYSKAFSTASSDAASASRPSGGGGGEAEPTAAPGSGASGAGGFGTEGAFAASAGTKPPPGAAGSAHGMD